MHPLKKTISNPWGLLGKLGVEGGRCRACKIDRSPLWRLLSWLSTSRPQNVIHMNKRKQGGSTYSRFLMFVQKLCIPHWLYNHYIPCQLAILGSPHVQTNPPFLEPQWPEGLSASPETPWFSSQSLQAPDVNGALEAALGSFYRCFSTLKMLKAVHSWRFHRFDQNVLLVQLFDAHLSIS